MLPIDSLVTIGLAALSLGTINESDGTQRREFCLRNAGTEAVTLVQGYTSCGCVKLTAPIGVALLPGHTVKAVLSFDPKGKGGEFYERGTIVYGQSRKRLDISLQGTCVSSEETLQRQFPVRLSDKLRISADRFDLGCLSVGEERTVNVVVLHRSENDRREVLPISFKPAKGIGKGVHHLTRSVVTMVGGEEYKFDVVLMFRI